ncbi:MULTISPECIES: C40 family peptidase [unclassified Ruegeria]|uniref:C40 family peptidase n=1 Tax=unclassified Ruegeria TaxID=2625375 RepID=UPI0014898FDA|nr:MULTISPECIES: C40 family peptidase [unclassified Ruegeria]NOD64937.1 NLP/P60 hydrolase [Ruegeria sp. HKCCD6109]
MTRLRISKPVVDLLRDPKGPRDRQVLFGDTVQVADEKDGWSRVIADKDGYTGWLQTDQLTHDIPATHWIKAPATHAYESADFKSRDLESLSFGSKVHVLAETDRYLETELGFVPKGHTAPISETQQDPVAVAELFLGTPYLWGGNSRFGIDCSGLVQAALLACGVPCPGDSGDQETALGTTLAEGSAAQRGDLLFWKGHVAWVSGDNMILHANASHMAVVFEPMDQAIERIQAQGNGPVTAHKRL